MVLYVTEKEMVERFGDSCKEASSRCKELIGNEDFEKPETFLKLVSALKVAAGSSHQLSMAQMNPKWLIFRDTLEHFSEFCQANVFKQSESLLWMTISRSLHEIGENGKKLANAKAPSREDVLFDLNLREKAARVDN